MFGKYPTLKRLDFVFSLLLLLLLVPPFVIVDARSPKYELMITAAIITAEIPSFFFASTLFIAE
jgi:hypothetical protein